MFSFIESQVFRHSKEQTILSHHSTEQQKVYPFEVTLLSPLWKLLLIKRTKIKQFYQISSKLKNILLCHKAEKHNIAIKSSSKYGNCFVATTATKQFQLWKKNSITDFYELTTKLPRKNFTHPPRVGVIDFVKSYVKAT